MARSRSAHAGGFQMTVGFFYKNILLFSVPLIFSQLLQVLFNMADVAVVGKFSSATATICMRICRSALQRRLWAAR